MAYRKTENVLAGMEAKRLAIIAAAIDVISKVGMSGVTTPAVAQRAGIASGLIYTYFPDKAELVAAIVAFRLARDVAVMREATTGEPAGLPALAAALAVFYESNMGERPRVVRAMSEAPAYRLGMRDEFKRLMRPAIADLSPKDPQRAAAAALGALFGLLDVEATTRNSAPLAVLFVLRGLGVGDAAARRVIARRYSLVTA